MTSRSIRRHQLSNHIPWGPMCCIVLQTLSGGCSESTEGGACAALLQCCEVLAPGLQGQCRSTYDQWSNQAEAERGCQEAMAAMGGQCSGSADAQGNEPTWDSGAAGVDLPSTADTGSLVPSAPCTTYITCVAQATPAGLAPVLAAYGKGGSCWLQGDPGLCDSACHKGTIDTHKAFPGANACNTCQSAADCPSQQPVCDARGGRCIECHGDDDCTSYAKPVCDLQSSTCAECHADADCHDSTRPACQVETSTCVSCLNDQHCDVYNLVCDVAAAQCVQCTRPEQCFFNQVCDAVSGTCRPCQDDGECHSGLCHQGQCVECESDAQCGGGTPHCSSSHRCVACLEDAHCAPGVCTWLNTCCGATACADQNAECGTATDLACLFTSIPCGNCGTGDTCVQNNSCEPTPVNDCASQSCPGQKCGYVPGNNAYQCIPSNPKCGKGQPICGPGYDCDEYWSDIIRDYVRFCTPYCLNDTDCAGAQVCVPQGGPTSYGTCKAY